MPIGWGSPSELNPEQRLLARLGAFHGDSRAMLAAPIRGHLGVSVFDEPQAEFSRNVPAGMRAAERTTWAYMRGYLQEDILVKVDRASMATSLEVRSPFLDPAIIDFALSLPATAKLPGMRRKDPLRRVMRGRIPDRIIDRPKRGFGVPLSAWLRGSLSSLVDDYLSDSRLRTAGILDPVAVGEIVKRHRAGSDEAGNQIWLLLQFEMWRDRWIDGSTAVGPS